MIDLDLIEKFSIDKSDWVKVKFGDVVYEPKESVKDPIAEGIEHVVGLEHIDSEDIHLRRSASIEKSTTFTKKFAKGDVLFGRRRAYLKKAARADFDGICSGDITVIRANDQLLPELLPFIVNNDKFFDHAIKHSAGGLSPRVKFKDLAEYEFLLPSKYEQYQLAKLFTSSSMLSELKKAHIEKLKIYLKSFQDENLSFGYDEKTPCLPKSWKKLRIKDFSKVRAGSTPLRANKEFFDGGKVSWVKTLDLNNGSIFNTEEKITQLALDKTSCKIRPLGTVLVAMYGGFNQIGRTGFLEVPAATNQAVSAVEVNKEIVNPKFLLYVLNSRIEYWKKVAVSSRKDPNITKDDVESFPVSFPPLDNQNALVHKIDLILETLSVANNEKKSFHSLMRLLTAEVF